MAFLPGFDMESLAQLPWFTIYMVLMTALVAVLLLALVLVLAYKLSRLDSKLDQISRDAGKFIQMGMAYFKKGSNK